MPPQRPCFEERKINDITIVAIFAPVDEESLSPAELAIQEALAKMDWAIRECAKVCGENPVYTAQKWARAEIVAKSMK